MEKLEIMVCAVIMFILIDFHILKDSKELEEKARKSLLSYSAQEGRNRGLKMMSVKIINSTIKGHYVYHIRPTKSIKMQVKKEQDNIFDQYAMVVKIAESNQMSNDILQEISRPAKKNTLNNVLVKDIAGKLVGRVLANLGKAIYRVWKDIGEVSW